MAEKNVFVTLLKSKLDIVTIQKDELQGTFDAYIEQLKAQVQAVTETGEQQPGQLGEMNSVLEAVLEYLKRLNITIKDAAVSGSPLQTPDTQGITGSESVAISELVQRIKMMEMAMIGCHGEIRQSSVQQTDMKQQMEARCESLEDKLESLESKHASEVKKQVSALQQKEDAIERLEVLNDQQYEELVKLEEKHNERLDDVEKQLKEVKLGYQESKTENLQKLDDVKKQLQKLRTEDKHEAKFDKMEKQMKEMKMKFQGAESKNDKFAASVNKRLQKLQDEGKREDSQLQNLIKEVKTLKKESIRRQEWSKVDQIDTQMGTLSSQVETMNHEVEMLKSQVDTMTDQVDTVETSVKQIVIKRNKDKNKRRALEKRVAGLEAKRSKAAAHYFRELGELKSLFSQVCQMVADRVEPLRRLQRILNNLHFRVEKRQELAIRVDEVTRQVKSLSLRVDNFTRSSQHTKRCDDIEKKLKENDTKHQQSEKANMNKINDVKKRLQQLEDERKHSKRFDSLEKKLRTIIEERCKTKLAEVMKESRDLSRRVGTFNNPQHQALPAFTAQFPYGTRPVTEWSYIKDFTIVRSNLVNCYSPETGLFTAPRDGVCVATVSLLQVGEGEVGACVRYERFGRVLTRVCYTMTRADKTSSCGVGVVEVKAGDTLGVRVYHVDGKPQLSCLGTSFSCFFIS